MPLQNLSWLLIGIGVGISVGEDNLFIFLFGILLLITGFIINYIDERLRKKEQFHLGIVTVRKPKGLNTSDVK